MRLLNAETICLEEYFEESVPKYAILSHTWGPGEVSFQDLNQDPNHKSKAGYHKIAESCRLAVQYGYGYVWVDTCCIDKSSSAELSEAINSMCRWYENSGVCFVYLADVPSDDDVFDDNSAFSQSRWHSRGWTLQELLAPKQHVFFGSNWGRMFDFCWGFDHEADATSMKLAFNASARYRALMKETTDIDLISDLYYLDSPSPWKKCSVATKLSWASRRRTTRKEDIAYCLLGLLEVQIPLLYGEGDNAFRRLLIKLMEQDNSHDIFLAGYGVPGVARGDLLPCEPSMCKGCSHDSLLRLSANGRPPHYTVTNAGLLISLPVIEVFSNKIILAALDFATNDKHRLRLTLPLAPCVPDSDIYEIVPYHGIVLVNKQNASSAKVRNIYIRIKPRITKAYLQPRLPKRDVQQLLDCGFVVLSVYYARQYDCSGSTKGMEYQRPRGPSIYILGSEKTAVNLAILCAVEDSRHCLGLRQTRCASAIEFLLQAEWNPYIPPGKEQHEEYVLKQTKWSSRRPIGKAKVQWHQTITTNLKDPRTPWKKPKRIRISYPPEAMDGQVRVEHLDGYQE